MQNNTGMATRRGPIKLRVRYIVFVAIALMVSLMAYDQGDFIIFYRAGQALVSGASPFAVAGFMSPLHLLAYVVLFSLLPYDIALHPHC